MENDSTLENNGNNAYGKSMEKRGYKEDYKDSGRMTDDDNTDNDTPVRKEGANENGSRNMKEHTDMKRNHSKINTCPGTPLATNLKVLEKANEAYLATAK